MFNSSLNIVLTKEVHPSKSVYKADSEWYTIPDDQAAQHEHANRIRQMLMTREKNWEISPPELRDAYAPQNNGKQVSPRCVRCNPSSKMIPKSFPTITQH